MKKSFAEQQIIRILKAHDGFLRASGSFAGRQGTASRLSTAGRANMRELDSENRKLKEPVADQSLDNKILIDFVTDRPILAGGSGFFLNFIELPLNVWSLKYIV